MAETLDFNKPVRLRIQASDDNIAIVAAPKKNDSDEEDALTAIEYLLKMLSGNRVPTQKFYRNTPAGDRVDMLAVRWHG